MPSKQRKSLIRKKSKVKKSVKKTYRNRSKGWSAMSPKRGKERYTLLTKCGRKCFLLPNKKKFPVCSRSSCKINCKGVAAAKSRARQYQYDAVARLAEKYEKLYC